MTSRATFGTGGVADYDTYFELSLRVMLGWRGMLCLCDAITELRLVRRIGLTIKSNWDSNSTLGGYLQLGR
jgi:hypothetical protein